MSDVDLVDEMYDALEANDENPMTLLDHREWPYILAEWYDSEEFEDKKKYQKVVNYINWRSVDMRRDDFDDQIELVVAEIQDDEDSQSIHELSPSEFFREFTWNDMPDRQIAYFCHLWERVIETFSMKEAGCWNCVYERQHPARRSFGRRLLECRGYGDSTAVRVLGVRFSA